MSDDTILLCRYVEQRSDDAFTALVRRHINLVYFSALRQTGGDALRAEDAAQETFLRLSKSARQLQNHPALAGWLHATACNCAREMKRSELRRTHREQVTQGSPVVSDSAFDAEWLKVRPVIDEALLELPEPDREAVLLRFFEGQSFSEIGSRLHVAENAARMRVTRALELLAGILSKRGITSSAVALEAVLAIPAATAAPDYLAQQISVSVAGTVVGAMGVANVVGARSITALKVVATAASLATAVATGLLVHENSRSHQLEARLAEVESSRASQRISTRTLETRLAAEKKRADDTEVDNDRLLAAIADLKKISPGAGVESTGDDNVTEQGVNDRFKHAQQLAREGKMAEALREFLWCYDTGMKRFARFGGVRQSFLLSAITQLGETYPPALDELRTRRDAAKARLLSDSTQTGAALDYGNLNRALGEGTLTLELFDSLAPDDPRRRAIGYQLTDTLIESKRYSDVLSVQPFSRMQQTFETMQSLASQRPDAALRTHVVTSTAQSIEALAGGGDIPHARELMGKLLAFDNSAQTRAALHRGLARAGQSDLLSP